MSERFPKMDKMKLMAHALCDEEEPELERFGDREAVATIVGWYNTDENLYCELHRHVDDIGTDFILYVYDSDAADEREIRGQEPEPIEWYELLYDSPNVLITRDKTGLETGRYTGYSDAHNRMYQHLDLEDIRVDLLSKRTQIDDEFKRVVGYYALGDDVQ